MCTSGGKVSFGGSCGAEVVFDERNEPPVVEVTSGSLKYCEDEDAVVTLTTVDYCVLRIVRQNRSVQIGIEKRRKWF